MIHLTKFVYDPLNHEGEKASNSYLMSLLAQMVGLPLPMANLLATFLFYLGNKKGTYFVRWHCTQALLSQIPLFFINSYSFWWTVSIIFFNENVNNNYISYIIAVIFFNLIEIIATIYTTIQVRKGIHVEWWFYASLCNLICKPKL